MWDEVAMKPAHFSSTFARSGVLKENMAEASVGEKGERERWAGGGDERNNQNLGNSVRGSFLQDPPHPSTAFRHASFWDAAVM